MAPSESNSALLVLDLPDAAFCGIDLLSFTTSPRFRGIKDLPSGWHFIFASVNNAFSLRHGVWFRIAKEQGASVDLHVKKWNAADEELIAASPEDHVHWRAALGGIWREGLTPYRQSAQGSSAEDGAQDVDEKRQDWLELTRHITSELLSRMVGAPGEAHNHWALNSASSAKQDEDVIPGVDDIELADTLGPELHFFPIDLKRTWRDGAVGRERTEGARDRSWKLDDLLSQPGCSADALLGELQFTFLMVLTINNNSCMEQWKRIIGLVLTCTSAVLTRSSFFTQFLALLRLQLQHCSDAEGGLFDMTDEAGNILKALLKRFRQGLDTLSGLAKVQVADELDELEEFLTEEHGWLRNDSVVKRGMLDLEDGERVEMDMESADEDQEDGDYAPVVVELTPAQARELGMQHNIDLPLHQRHVPDNEKADSDGSGEDDRDLEEMDGRY